MSDKLLLDYDLPMNAAKRLFEQRTKLLFGFYKFKFLDVQWSISSGGVNTHCRVLLNKELPEFDIVFMQLYLGSDSARELMNFFRVKKGVKDWNRLFILKQRSFITKHGEQCHIGTFKKTIIPKQRKDIKLVCFDKK